MADPADAATIAQQVMRDIESATQPTVERINDLILHCTSAESSEISDGAHTFGELYRERTALTAALARTALMLRGASGMFDSALYDAHLGDDEQPGFDGYRTVLYIRLPTGQVSWHIADADCDLVHDIPHTNVMLWDGHDTAEKNARVERFARGSF